MRILALCGSLQARSSNLTLLQAAVAAAPAGVEVVIFDGVRDLPLFNPDLESEAPLAVVEAWRRALAASDAVLFASPEYGFSMPGSLKNAIDWVIGSGELEQKLVGLTAAVTHPDRGRRGLAALRDTLFAVSARIAFEEPLVRGPSFEQDVSALLRELVAAARRGQPTVTIQQLGEREWPRFRVIRLRALRDAPGAFWTTHEEAAAWPPEKWMQQLASFTTFVAVLDGADVGVVRGMPAASGTASKSAVLASLWVDPAARGRGVGDALIDSVVAWARSRGHAELLLDVADDNLHAIALYERRGFVPTGMTGSLPPPREHVREHQRSLEL